MLSTRAVIHVEPRIEWQASFAPKVAEGLRASGIPYAMTQSRQRLGNAMPILLGTTCWRGVEADGPFLLLDRCSFGDPANWISIVLNGHGRRGDHRVPAVRDGSRWERHAVEVYPWRTSGTRAILCGQTETYSPHFATIEEWYDVVAEHCTHFRPHPAAPTPVGRSAAVRLQSASSWDSCRRAVTLNSSVAVHTVFEGIPTVTMDEGAMAWDVTAHCPNETRLPDRTEWLHWLAWTQWTHDEIRRGIPWGRFL
jgi:hypothetical protein